MDTLVKQFPAENSLRKALAIVERNPRSTQEEWETILSHEATSRLTWWLGIEISAIGGIECGGLERMTFQYIRSEIRRLQTQPFYRTKFSAVYGHFGNRLNMAIIELGVLIEIVRRIAEKQGFQDFAKLSVDNADTLCRMNTQEANIGQTK